MKQLKAMRGPEPLVRRIFDRMKRIDAGAFANTSTVDV